MDTVDQLGIVKPPAIRKPSRTRNGARRPDPMTLAALGLAASALVIAGNRKPNRASLRSPAVFGATP
jgi:hypothetical protein